MSVAITIDDDSSLPPYEQLRSQLAFQVRSGHLAPGDRLPTVRQLAGDLGLATNTVARAYGELERLVRIVHDGGFDEALASLYWAHVHGLACLLVDGPLGLRLPTAKARLAHVRATSERFASAVMEIPETGTRT